MVNLTKISGQRLSSDDEEPTNQIENLRQSRATANSKSAAPDFPTIAQAIVAWAQSSPDQIALLSTGYDPIDYSSLVHRAHCISNTLEARGISPTQRVALCIEDRPSMALSLIGLIFHGASIIPVDPSIASNELEEYVGKLRVNAIVTIAGEDTVAKEVGQGLGIPLVELNRSDPGCGLQIGDTDFETTRPVSLPNPTSLALVLSTSGTTERKFVPKSHLQWAIEVAQRAKWLGLSPQDRCLNVMPLFYAQGIHEGLLAPLISGGSTIISAKSDVESFFSCLEIFKPNWFYAVYTFYREVLSQKEKYGRVLQGASLSFLKAGGMRFPDAEVAKIEDLFNAPLVISYGSSEAGYISCMPLPPEERKAGSVGQQVIDELKVIDQHGASVETGTAGEVVVRGPGVMSGYLDDPEANAQAFIDGWLRTGDEGYLDADGFLYLTGRIKDMINRGGQKISPAEIDDALIAHPDVAAAAVFAIPHQTLGEEVAAAVVPQDGAKVTEGTLKEFLAQRLSAHKIPRRIYFVDDLPKNANGKIRRHDLANVLKLDGPARIAESVTPPTDLEKRLQDIWATSLGRDSVGLHDDYFVDLGGDSLQAVELFLRLEETFDRQLPLSILIEASNVAAMARYIESTTTPDCLVPMQPKGEKAPFFCVHDIEGDVFTLRALAQHLGETRPFYGLRYFGSDGATRQFADLDAMARYYVGEIRKVQPSGPYFLGGHSFGGKAAFVMAQQLRADGEDVALLALMDSFSGRGPQNLPMPQWIAQHIRTMAAQPMKTWPAYVLQRASKNAVLRGQSLVNRSLSAVGWITRSEALHRYLYRTEDPLKALSSSYRLKPYAGDAVLFKAELDAWAHPKIHDGWHDLIQGHLQVIQLEGSHMDILREPHVRVLASKLAACIRNNC